MCYLKMKVSPFNDMSWAGPARGHSRQQWPPQAGPRDSGRSPLCDRTQIQRPLHTEAHVLASFRFSLRLVMSAHVLGVSPGVREAQSHLSWRATSPPAPSASTRLEGNSGETSRSGHEVRGS